MRIGHRTDVGCAGHCTLTVGLHEQLRRNRIIAQAARLRGRNYAFATAAAGGERNRKQHGCGRESYLANHFTPPRVCPAMLRAKFSIRCVRCSERLKSIAASRAAMLAASPGIAFGFALSVRTRM